MLRYSSVKLITVTAAVAAFGIGAVPSLALAQSPDAPQLASTGSAIDDTVITTKIKAAYVQDPVVGVLDIGVETVRGVVHLRGQVNSEAEKERAATIAKSVEGVQEVQNDIRVK